MTGDTGGVNVYDPSAVSLPLGSNPATVMVHLVGCACQLQWSNRLVSKSEILGYCDERLHPTTLVLEASASGFIQGRGRGGRKSYGVATLAVDSSVRRTHPK